MTNKAWIVALFPLLTVACGEVEGTQLSPMNQTSAALSSTDPILGEWCLADYSWGCIYVNSSGIVTQVNNADVCWYAGDTVYPDLTSTGTNANGNPTYAGTRHYGGSAARCSDANWYSATLYLWTNPSNNRLELKEAIQVNSSYTNNITWARSP